MQLNERLVRDVAALRPVQRDTPACVHVRGHVTVVPHDLLRLHVVCHIPVIVSAAHKVPHSHAAEVAPGEEHKVKGFTHQTARGDGENPVHYGQRKGGQLGTHLYLRQEVAVPHKALVGSLDKSQTLEVLIHVGESLESV